MAMEDSGTVPSMSQTAHASRSPSQIVTLQCKNGALIQTTVDVAGMSRVFKSMLEDCKVDDADGAVCTPIPTIPIQRFDVEIMAHVLEYMQHHTDAESGNGGRPPSDEYRVGHIGEWDTAYVDKFTFHELVDMLNASDYLGIAPLYDLIITFCVQQLLRGSAAAAFFGVDPNSISEESCRAFADTHMKEMRVAKQREINEAMAEPPINDY